LPAADVTANTWYRLVPHGNAGELVSGKPNQLDIGTLRSDIVDIHGWLVYVLNSGYFQYCGEIENHTSGGVITFEHPLLHSSSLPASGVEFVISPQLLNSFMVQTVATASDSVDIGIAVDESEYTPTTVKKLAYLEVGKIGVFPFSHIHRVFYRFPTVTAASNNDLQWGEHYILRSGRQGGMDRVLRLSASFSVYRGYTRTFNLASNAQVSALGSSFTNWSVSQTGFSISASGVLTGSPASGAATISSVTVTVDVDGATWTIHLPIDMQDSATLTIASWEVTRGLSQTRNLLSYQDVTALGSSFTGWSVSQTGFSVSSSGVVTADLALNAATISSVVVSVTIDTIPYQITIPLTYALLQTAEFTVFIGHTDTFDVAADSTVMQLGTNFSGWTVSTANYAISSAGVLTATIPSTDPGTQGSVAVQVTVDGVTGTIYVPLMWGTIHPAQSVSWTVIRGLERTLDVASDSTIAALGTTFSDWAMTTATGFSINSSGEITTTPPWIGSVVSSLSVTCRIDGAPASITVSVTARDAFAADILTGYSTGRSGTDLIESFYSLNRSHDGTAQELYTAETFNSVHQSIQAITVSSDSSGYADVSALQDAMDIQDVHYALITEWKDTLTADPVHMPAVGAPENKALIAYKNGGVVTFFQNSNDRYYAQFGYDLSTLTGGAVSRTITSVRYHVPPDVGHSPAQSFGLMMIAWDGDMTVQSDDKCGDNNSYPGMRKKSNGNVWELRMSGGPDPNVTPPLARQNDYFFLFSYRHRYWSSGVVVTPGGQGNIIWRSLEEDSVVIPTVYITSQEHQFGTGREMQGSNFRFSEFAIFDIPLVQADELNFQTLETTFGHNAAAFFMGAVPDYT